MGSTADRLAMHRLESICGSRAASYCELMGVMVSTTNIHELFYKDYKQTTFGFSVVKSKDVIDMRTMAELNNTKHHLPLTVVKNIIYSEDFTSVVSETIVLATNPNFHDKGFNRNLIRAVAAACKAFQHRDPEVKGDRVILRNNPMQVPRLLLMPLIETIVKEHMRFRYSDIIDRYVSMGFYNDTNEIYGESGEEEITRSGISYLDVKTLLEDKSSTSFLTLPDFWKVYHEMQDRNDILALNSLQDSRHIEILDTFIPSPNTIIHGSSPAQKITFQEARPALINPIDGDETLGIPCVIHSPDKYDDRRLWRYWSPDTSCEERASVATRGHIFVMGQTSIDLKVGPKEATKQMTFRPIYRDIPDMKVELEEDLENNWIRVKVFPRRFCVFKDIEV